MVWKRRSSERAPTSAGTSFSIAAKIIASAFDKPSRSIVRSRQGARPTARDQDRRRRRPRRAVAVSRIPSRSAPIRKSRAFAAGATASLADRPRFDAAYGSGRLADGVVVERLTTTPNGLTRGSATSHRRRKPPSSPQRAIGVPPNSHPAAIRACLFGTPSGADGAPCGSCRAQPRPTLRGSRKTSPCWRPSRAGHPGE